MKESRSFVAGASHADNLMKLFSKILFWFPKTLFFILAGLPILLILLQNPFGAEGLWLKFEVLEALKNVLVQVIFTLFFAWLIGVPLFFGILSLKVRIKYIDFLVLLPFLMPSLLLISIYFSWASYLPIGNLTVGAIQGLSLGGLFAFTLSRYYYHKWIVLEETAYLLGASAKAYWQLILFGSQKIISQLNITGIFFAVTSFSIPFMVGGSRGVNFEVLIYEKIRISNNTTEALQLGFGQIALLLMLNFFFRSYLTLPEYKLKIKWTQEVTKYVNSVWLLAPCTYLTFFIKPLTEGLTWGLPKIYHIFITSQELNVALTNSAWLYLGAVSSSFFVLLLLGYFLLQLKGDHYAFLWIAPTPALVLVALLPMVKINQLATLYLAFFMLFIPSVIKIMLPQQIATLRSQVETAYLLGASEGQIFLKVYYPQVSGLIAFLASVFGFWCLLDFSLVQLIMDQSYLYLGPLIQSWFASYRYYEAMGLLLILIVWGTLGIGWTYAKLNLYQKS